MKHKYWYTDSLTLVNHEKHHQDVISRTLTGNINCFIKLLFVKKRSESIQARQTYNICNVMLNVPKSFENWQNKACGIRGAFLTVW